MISQNAHELFATLNPYGTALENHCIRLAEFSKALANHQELDVDFDLIQAGAWLHDIGLLVKKDNTPNYLYRGAAFVAPYLEEWKLEGDEKKQMIDMLLYNHSVKTVAGISPSADLMRCAVQVEHSLGAWSHGLSREVRRNVFKTHPRKGLNRVLIDFLRISARRDGVVELVRLFFPFPEEGV